MLQRLAQLRGNQVGEPVIAGALRRRRAGFEMQAQRRGRSTATCACNASARALASSTAPPSMTCTSGALLRL
ncbi:hypothetical protein C7E25_22015, partial [Stenotrophomonas maltophilia]